MNMQIDLEKGIANVGDVSRMKEVMARAKRGGRLVIGFIGGSITQGSLSSTPQTCYAYRVYTWWKETFPQAEFVYCNAGIGGTTSEFGAARVGTDLLAERPDFVIVEFSVNDESTEHFKETYEGLVRKILGAAWNPAVLLVHNVFYHNGANAQVMHAAIGRHYDLPSVSMQNSIYPEVVAGRIENRAITPDDLHPNDEGHALVASVITYFLEQVRSGKLTGSNASFAPGQSFRFRLQKMPTRILSASAMPRRRIWQDCSSPRWMDLRPMRPRRMKSRTASAMAGRRKRRGMPSPFWWRAAALPSSTGSR